MKILFILAGLCFPILTVPAQTFQIKGRVYNASNKEPDVLVQVKDINGKPLVDPENPNRYILKYLPMTSGTVLPTIGIIVEL